MEKDYKELEENPKNEDGKKTDTYFQEMVMLSHKVDRHEKWLRQIAEKAGIKLESF